MLRMAKMELQFAQHHQKRFADRLRREPVPLAVGDSVWLDSRNIKTQRPSAKLDHRRFGPFKILEVVNPVAYRLELPPSMKIHPVFHVSLLQPVSPDYHVDYSPLPPVVVDGTLEYEVDEILNSRIRRNKLEYLVNWKGFGPQDRTWEPHTNMTHCAQLLDDFHVKNPTLPSPHQHASIKPSRAATKRRS